ncbi:hypothetical protein PC39_12431 [Salinisphaera sp. PC39]|uniref:TIGR04282 family arsenosugar biosynthesis glycosyltransferase n=1 Tax=Salinisphaera sp. PC39 TaxID=1304156 RepID=UPI00333FA08F
MHHPDSRILIFAKAPVPGRCKTRLAAGLGPRRAAAVYRRLLRATVAEAARSRAAPVELWCSPDSRHPCFASLRRDHAVVLRRQPGGDLGRRMHSALASALTRSRAALVIGGDCPVLAGGHLHAALGMLAEGTDAVFAPAEDGGYALVGLRAPAPALFRDVAWGGPRVMTQTRRRLDALDLRAGYLEPVWDVDTPADFRRARRAGLI